MTADPGLGLLLDPERVAALVASEGCVERVAVRVTRLRTKPGVSTAAALVRVGDDHPVGWIRTLTGDARAKADKVRSRLADLGLLDLLGEADTADGTLVQWGPLHTDPALARALAELDLPGGLSGVVVLRYNPLRRLVLRAGDLVHRVTAERHRTRLTRTAQALGRAGVPVLLPAPDGGQRSRRVTTWPWLPDGDATGTTDPTLWRRVGSVLAALHDVDPAGLGLPGTGWAELRAAAEASVTQLELVTAADGATLVGPAARELLTRLDAVPVPAAPGVVSHGDFSLDQCLLGGDKAVWLTDLDRAAVAPVALDLATLVATDLVAGRSGWVDVLDGYAAAGGLVERPEVPGGWVAAVLLSRITEPWRAQRPDWREETDRIVRLATAQLDAAQAPDDPALPALAQVAAQGQLVVHRVGRRAVVRLADRYAKVLRPGRGARIARTAGTGHQLATAAGLDAPRVLSATDDVVTFSVVAGQPLHELSDLPAESWTRAWQAWADCWMRFQSQPADGLRVHGPAEEAAVLRMWADRAAAHLAGTPWPERLEETAQTLADRPAVHLVPTHRDLHDKQVLWDGQRLGVLDLDTLGRAEAALDPANLAVHADLRVAQGLWGRQAADEVVGRARAVASAAGVDEEQWQLYTAATVARLVAVYATRERWADTVADWAQGRWGAA